MMTGGEVPETIIDPDPLERRFITVMFCDMVGSTALSERLDPEDLMDILQLFRESTIQIVHKFGGHLASILGDGLMIYFGYPATHEDDAIRAARTGLEIMRSLEMLNRTIKERYDEEVSVRIGIHTGLVVVEPIGLGRSRRDYTAVGVTPNIAARLQELAKPNELVISSVTWRLLKFQFNTISLGRKKLKGIQDPVQVFRVLSFNKDQSDTTPFSTGSITTRVDRNQELEILQESWAASASRHGQAVLVVGEAGIGKTRLAMEFIRQLPADEYSLFDYFGSEHHSNIAFYPIIERLQRVHDIDNLESAEKRQQFFQTLFGQSRELDSKLLVAFEALLTNRGNDTALPPGFDPQDAKVAIRRAMLGVVEEAAQDKPVLIWVDDYQWLDFSSREILHSLPGLLENLPVMILITCRPGPFLEQLSGWEHKKIELDRFSREYGRQMCANVFDRQLPSTEMLDLLIERSEGVPLFLEELSASVLESNWSDDKSSKTAKEFILNEYDIPTSLTGTIMARLDRLGEAKEVAHAAAVQGQIFDTAVVGCVCSLDNESLLRSLSLLMNAGLVVEQDASGKIYRFKHALVREVAVQSLVKSKRRQMNLAVAKAVEAGKTELSPVESDLLGHYYERAGEYQAASHYYFQAGRESGRKSANVEAVNQLRQALQTLHKLPETKERDELELSIQATMIGPSIAAFGYAASDVEMVLERALELLGNLPGSPLIFPVLFSRWAVYQVLGRTRAAYEVAGKTRQLAAKINDTGARLIGHRLLGTSLILLGDPEQGIVELEKAIELFNPAEHSHLIHICGTDPMVSAQALMAFATWFTGNAERSTMHAKTTLDLAEKGGHANTIGYALSHIAILTALRNDVDYTKDVAERLLAFAIEKELPFWIAHARAFQAWVLANSGDPARALEIFLRGLAFLDQAGIIYWRPTYLSWIAQAHMSCGAPKKALEFLDAAEQVIATSEECWMESEILRLKGVIAAEFEPFEPEKANAYFSRARSIAVEQKSINLEIRVVYGQARLLVKQNEDYKARSMLIDFMSGYPSHSSSAEAEGVNALLVELDTRAR